MTIRISTEERETVRDELAAIAERLVARYRLTIPEARQLLREMLSVSV
jgi:hypothetical protein